MTRQRFMAISAALLMALALAVGSVQAREREPGDDRGRGGRVHPPPPTAAVVLHARLVGTEAFPAAHGRVRYKERRGERQFHLRIEDVRLPAGTVLTVLVDGQPIGQVTLNRRHKGRLALSTALGHTVPSVAVGTTVGLVGPAGERVAVGRFAPRPGG